MEIKIVLFTTLLVYAVVVAQSFSYIISLRDVQKNMTAVQYISFRKLTDKNFRKKFTYIFYATLLSSTTLCLITLQKPGSMLFAGAVIAWLAFIADAWLMIKGNLPINNLINQWSEEQYPNDWYVSRDKWLKTFTGRQIANIAGFISLLAAAVFQ